MNGIESQGERAPRAASQVDAIEQACQRADEMRRAGARRCDILTGLVTAAEALAGPGSVASILILDRDGLLCNGASPQLPPDYLQAIDRLKPDAHIGTCAAAAATGCVVITSDFCADDKWAELRHLPMALGFVGAWSVPIKAADGTVLGTFGTYFRERRSPRSDERSGVERLATAAAAVLDPSR